ncbi:MAG: penicillin acylase family protein, partial [Roseomonas sp.]|nr:penicillin acylase family protein [Roseomonas sp.]
DWRLRRIFELLGARDRHDAAGFAAMQNDIVSPFAREVLPTLLAIQPSPQAARAHALLRGWDGAMRADAPQPLIFHAWLRAFRPLALEAGGAPPTAETGPEFMRLLLHPDGRGRAWCGEDLCRPQLARALEDAVRGLSDTHGADPTAWRWGTAHVARFEHPLLRFIPGIGALLRLEVATGGDGETIARGGFRDGGAAPFAHMHGAGLRLVADLGDPDGVLAMIATGQSGHPLSDHWGSLLQRWRDGGVLRLGRDAEREAGRILLTP